jgi:hypothetical protein
MASVVLSQQGTLGDTLYAGGGIIAGTGGLNTPSGNVTAKNIFGTRISVIDDDPAGANAGLDITNKAVTAAGTPAANQTTTFVVNSGTVNPGPVGDGEGCLKVFNTSAGALVSSIVSSQVPPRGIVALGPQPAVPGDHAIWGMVAPFQSGTATIPAAATTVAVANTAVLAGTIVMVTPTLIDATAGAGATSVAVTAGTGFTIEVSAATTADLPVNWFIVHY